MSNHDLTSSISAARTPIKSERSQPTAASNFRASQKLPPCLVGIEACASEAAARPAANKETNFRNSRYYVPPGGLVDAIRMTRLKQFIHPGFAISVIGHIGALILALLFFYAGADSSRPRPPPPPQAISVDVIPPDAMVADIVPPKETPRLEGTPSDSAFSGSNAPFKSNSPNTAAQAPPPKRITQSPPEHSNAADNADPKTSQPLTAQAEMVKAQMALPLAAQADTARPQTPLPETAHRETAKTQTSEPQPSPPQPDTRKAPDQPGAEQTLAQLALLGGPLGGGFEAPAIDAPTAAHDFTVAFRERVSACSALPASFNFGDKIEISLHVSFNPDGTLASPPKPNGTIASQKERELVQSAINALEKCQPYIMLPADKYKAWKTLDLVFGPMSFPGR